MHTLSDDDERMSVGSRGSVRVDDREYLEKGSRAASALTAGTLTSLGGTSSRRGSGETAITVDAETSIREIKEIHELKDQIQDVESKYTQNLKEVKDALGEVEEKYRKAMVSNAQLDNEKNNLMYLVDTLKDSMMELEELLSESRREYEDKVKEHEREKQAHKLLQFQCSEMKETLKQSEELLNEIRQLRIKQEGFTREISDLQETVEWKDKKIGALERQKEYTDAIRTERDELREEVVQLKDILKKHGIVLGPDLNINGDTAETPHDGTSGGDSEPTSQSTPAEGNGMLGHTEGFRSGEDEERGLCQGRLADPSRPDRTFREETQLLDRQMLEDLEDAQKQDVQDKKSNDDVQETKNSLEETSPGTEEPMGESNTPESEDQETPAGDILLEQESSSRTREVTVEPTRDRNKSEELERTAGDITEDPKEGPPGPDLEEEPETSVNITNTDQNLEPGPTEADAEEPMDTSQPSSGKKKKKKRRGKKKNVPQEEKKQQADVNEEKEVNKQNETEKSKAVEGSTVGDVEEQQRSTVKNEPHSCPLEPQIVNQIQTEVNVEGSTVGDVEQQQRSSVENGPHCSLEPQMDNQIHTVQDSHLTVDLEADSQVNQVAIEQMGEETKAGSKGEPTEESHVDQRGEDGAEEVITKQASRDDKEAETSKGNANDELITGEIKAGTDVELNECEMNLLRTELERENKEVQEPLLQVEDSTMIVDILEEAQRTFEPDEGPTEELDEIFSYSDALRKGLMDLVPGGPDLGKEESGEESLEVEDAPVGEPSKHPDSEIGLADTIDSGVFATEKLGEDSSADPVVSSKSTDYEALMDSALELMEVSENPEKRSEILSPDTSEKTCIIKDGLEEPEEGRSHPDNGNLDEEPGLEGEHCVDVGSTTIKQENAADANICVSQEILNVSVSEEVFDLEVSEEVLNQDVSEEVLNRDVSGEVLNQNVPDKVLNRDYSEEVLNQNVSEEVLNQKNFEEVLNQDVSGEVLNQEVSEEVLNQDASEEVLNQDVSGKVLNRDVPEEVLSRDVSKEVSNQDVSGERLNQEVQYEAVDEAPDSSSAEVVTLEDPAEAAGQVYGESEDTGHIIRPDLLQEDDEEDEGQSFDFDELDFDSALDLKDNPEVEEAEEALEVLEEAAGDSPSMKSISTEEWIEDVGGRSEDDSKALSEETTPDVRLSEDLSKEAVSTDSRLEDDIDTSVFQSNPDHKASNKEPPRSKKSGKKGKGKSKEECKMS